ncbi:PQQ-like beta-propeller repeat protein [Oscillochloris sp. ZM17-4]|uniref:outer membrane protein assembly factor BamB family protein n=1 Tax=Oscillochloris sp. ZM17-4 TaxID=2866714 RepID=UPI001C73131C|nr:PQQ-binding-like beta-propeller repeat protein [Oscillochloris sp. ZM17-4]MBX0327009.1 PQQ-like beta-propeller repeat protein [Oscillochloris sp. ZM17-4]
MENSRARVGCTIFLVVLILGVAIGAAGMAAFLGVGMNELAARANGQAAPVLVAVTPTVAVQIVGGAAPGRRLVWRAPIALDGDTREPDLLVISRNHDRKSDTLMRFSPDAGAVLWESPPLGDGGTSWVVAYGDQSVIIADGATLIGLSRADGGKIWEAPLTDKIFNNGCLNCLQVFGDAVVALSDDGELQSFSAATGAPLWSHRLNQATRQMVRVGDMVGVLDSLEKGGSDAGLFVYDPRDGRLARMIEPTCQEAESSYVDRPHYFDRFLADADAGALYWLLNGASCLLRVEMGAGGGEQRTYNEAFRSFDEDNTLLADGAIYLSAGKDLYAVDARGEVRLLLGAEDYSLRPLEARPDALLVLAQRTRGSSRLELWLIDPQSGQQRWARVLTASDPINGLYDSGEFAAHLTGDALALIEQQGDPEVIWFDLLSLQDGTSSVHTQLKVNDGSSYIRGVAWGNRTAWAAADELYGVSLESGATVSRWP